MSVSGTLSFKDLPGFFSVLQKNEFSCTFSNPTMRIKGLSCGFPEYLLSTELNTLLYYLPDLYQQTFITTLWHTGADTSEVLRLTRRSFVLKPPYPYVQFSSVKSICTRSFGSNYPKPPPSERIVPLLSRHYIMQLRQMIAERKLVHSLRNNELIWNIDMATANRWLHDAIHRAKKDGIRFPVNITFEAIRHSYVVFMLMQGVSPSLFQKILLGNSQHQ